MKRFVVERVFQLILSVWGVVTIVFLLTQLIPGDPARAAAGRSASPEQIEEARQTLGLDDSLIVQYFGYLARTFQFDLGYSTVTHQPIADDLLETFASTIQLVAVAAVIIAVVGVPIGVIAALRRGTAVDSTLRVSLAALAGIPIFWAAIMLQFVFADRLGWFPISGQSNPGYEPTHTTGLTLIDSLLDGDLAGFSDSLAHLILPATALAVTFLAHLARNVRTTMVTALGSDYVAFARAKGMGERRVVIHHALRSTWASSLTLMGMQLGWMVGYALLVESVFGLPGIGAYLHNAVTDQDIFAVLGGVVVIGLIFAITSFCVDLLQIRLDPRIRASLTGASR